MTKHHNIEVTQIKSIAQRLAGVLAENVVDLIETPAEKREASIKNKGRKILNAVEKALK